MRPVFAIVLLLSCGVSYAQQPPQTPQIKTEQKSKSTTNAEQVAADSQKTARIPSASIPISVSRIQASPTKPEGEHGGNEGSEFWPSIFGYSVKVTDSLLVLFTFLLWLATRGLVKGAEDTAQRQLRAYVVGKADIANLREIVNGYVAEIDIQNSGTTPAYDVHCWSEWKMLDDNESRSYVFKLAPKEIKGPRFVVNPGIIHTMSVEIKQSDEDRRTTQKRLYIWGEIRYRDAFQKNRWSRFRLYRHVHSGKQIWAYCDEGNETDDSAKEGIGPRWMWRRLFA